MQFVREAQKYHFLALEGGEGRSTYARLAVQNAVHAAAAWRHLFGAGYRPPYALVSTCLGVLPSFLSFSTLAVAAQWSRAVRPPAGSTTLL